MHTPAAADPAEHHRQPAELSPPVTAADFSEDHTIPAKPISSPSKAQEGSLAGKTAEVSVDQAPEEAAQHVQGKQSLIQQLSDQTLNQCLRQLVHVNVSDSTAA